MSEILADLSEPALVTAIKSNLYAFFGIFGRTPSVDFFSQPALMRWRTPIAHPLFQGVLVTGAAPGDEDRLIRESRDYFDEHGIAVFSCWFSPEVDVSPWEGPLRGLGFASDGDPPGMAVALDALVEPVPPARLSIARVENMDTLRTGIQGLPAARVSPSVRPGSLCLGQAFGSMRAHIQSHVV